MWHMPIHRGNTRFRKFRPGAISSWQRKNGFETLRIDEFILMPKVQGIGLPIYTRSQRGTPARHRSKSAVIRPSEDFGKSGNPDRQGRIG